MSRWSLIYQDVTVTLESVDGTGSPAVPVPVRIDIRPRIGRRLRIGLRIRVD